VSILFKSKPKYAEYQTVEKLTEIQWSKRNEPMELKNEIRKVKKEKLGVFRNSHMIIS
jgi:hypothetical protein